MTAILQCRALSYRYGDGTPALENVSLDLEEGRKVALVGPNGAGKSTLMLMFNGILRPSRGQVLFRGEALGENWGRGPVRRLGDIAACKRLHSAAQGGIVLGWGVGSACIRGGVTLGWTFYSEVFFLKRRAWHWV